MQSWNLLYWVSKKKKHLSYIHKYCEEKWKNKNEIFFVNIETEEDFVCYTYPLAKLRGWWQSFSFFTFRYGLLSKAHTITANILNYRD